MRSPQYHIPTLPLPYDLETRPVLRQLGRASRKLAELKGLSHTIPNERILISTLTLQEAKDSSSVENIITTHDDLYSADLRLRHTITNAATKEVMSYREALQTGFSLVKEHGVLTNNIVKQVQAVLEGNNAGFRRVPGTVLKSSDGRDVYTPPQDGREIAALMDNLEAFLNDENLSQLDPLVKMAIAHHQFESIHPFYDGNGRTGRIVNVLYLVISGLIDLPILYLSRYITHNKSEYYRLIQAIRDTDGSNAAEWEAWILFMLKGVEETAEDTIRLVTEIARLMSRCKAVLRPLFGKVYKHELLNNLFFHPYTKVEFMERDMGVERRTATKYLNQIVDAGILTKVKMGTTNYYVNNALMSLFLNISTATTKE